MTIDEALAEAKEHEITNKLTTREAADKTWAKVVKRLPNDAIQDLAREQFYQRLCVMHRTAARPAVTATYHLQVSNRKLPVPTTIEVTTVLHETRLEIGNGMRKALIEFGPVDCHHYSERLERIENGCQRRREVMENIVERLRRCKKQTVAELGLGEQTIIARAWQRAVEGKDTTEFERFTATSA